LTFDLLTYKYSYLLTPTVDHFMPCTVDHLIPIYIKFGLFSKYHVHRVYFRPLKKGVVLPLAIVKKG